MREQAKGKRPDVKKIRAHKVPSGYQRRNGKGRALMVQKNLLNCAACAQWTCRQRGLAERSKAAVLKTVVPSRGTGGSNPSPSAFFCFLSHTPPFVREIGPV